MDYPPQLFLCAALLLGLILESLGKLKLPWAGAALGVYLTVIGWYFVDPFQNPELYAAVTPGVLGRSYVQIAFFLVVFRFAVPRISAAFSKKLDLKKISLAAPSPGNIFFGLFFIWLPLFLIAVARMKWDFAAALLPVDGRAGETMWARGAVGGSTDFLVSAGGYIYLLVCGLFGVTLILQPNGPFKIFNLLVYLLVLPYFLLCGTRSLFLGAITPLFLCYLIMGRQIVWLRLAITAICFLGIHFVLLTVGEYRTIGFRVLFDQEAQKEMELFNKVEGREDLGKSQKQKGLNMIEELCFINDFCDSKIFVPTYGLRYLIEVTNAVPRVLWPDKPMIGIDYAIWRGFGTNDRSGSGGTGVNATISTGMIGGGLMNFGPYLGPIAPALLMAIWVGLLSRWWQQRISILRLCLFMAGLGLTFNLGRDITLLVLWPVVFGFVLVKIAEKFMTPKKANRQTTGPSSVRWKSRPGQVVKS